MKKIHTLTVALAVLAVLLTASAAMAVDFVVNATPGTNWVYSIQNNTATGSGRYVTAWWLYWADPIDDIANTTAAAANFDPSGGYISVPAAWGVDNTWGGPGFGITGATTTGVAPQTTSPNFTLHYKGVAATKAVLLWEDTQTGWGYVYQTLPTVPEPSGILTLILGCVGSIGFIRFRKR